MTFVQVSADTRTTTSLTTLTWNASGGSGSSSVFTLTLPRAGHFDIAIYLKFSVVDVAFGNSFTCTLGGTAGVSDSLTMSTGTNSGTHTFGYGFEAHGTYSNGATITFQVTSAAWNTGSVTAGQISAHFVPIPGTTN